MAAEAVLLGEFDSPGTLLTAVKELKRRGYQNLDTYTPFPIHGMQEALGMPRSRLTALVLPFTILGGTLAYLIQWWTNARHYPLNVGGRLPHSPFSFMPVTFEGCILLTALATFFGMFVLIGLPRLWHPLFEVKEFESVTINGYWVAVGIAGKEEKDVREELSDLGARFVVAPKELIP